MSPKSCVFLMLILGLVSADSARADSCTETGNVNERTVALVQKTVERIVRMGVLEKSFQVSSANGGGSYNEMTTLAGEALLQFHTSHRGEESFSVSATVLVSDEFSAYFNASSRESSSLSWACSMARWTQSSTSIRKRL